MTDSATPNVTDEGKPPSGAEEPTVSRFSAWSAILIFAAFCVFAFYLVVIVAQQEKAAPESFDHWDKLLFVFATFETLAVAAAGVLLGERLSVPSKRAMQAAETQALKASEDAEVARAEADLARREEATMAAEVRGRLDTAIAMINPPRGDGGPTPELATAARGEHERMLAVLRDTRAMVSERRER